MDKEYRVIDRKDLNADWWDKLVADSQIKNPMIYSYILDILSDNWCVLTNGKSWIPVPYDTKFGVKRARQHPFSRQIDVIGETVAPDLIEFLKSQFHLIDLGIGPIDFLKKDQHFQYLDLSAEPHYSNNAIRLIKRSNKFEYRESNYPKHLAELYEANTRNKMKLPLAYSIKLERIMDLFLEKKTGFLLEATENDVVKAAIFVILDKGTAYYLMADAGPIDKKEGVVFGLMDKAIQRSRELECRVFDFGGSNAASVAEFYKKFGALDQNYSRVISDTSPWWFKALKKLS
jgi:hypothetical protein